MNEDKDKIIDKIKKLFKLSESDNENEAILALRNAEKLMRIHNIEAVDMAEKFEITELTFQEGRLMGWKKYLAVIIAELFFCKVGSSYKTGKKQNIFVGNSASTSSCKEVYDKLIFWIDHKSKIEYPKSKTATRNEYKNGIVSGIFERVLNIFEERKSKKESTSLLVLDAEIKKHTESWGSSGKMKPMRAGKETMKGVADAKEAPIFQEVNS